MEDVRATDDTGFAHRNLGPYRIENEIGAGAMGTVYRAVHLGLDRAVALKVLRPDMLKDADSVRRFLREARSSARLEHPHIVSVYDAGEIDGVYYIAMKLLEGRTLQDILAVEGPFEPERVIRIGSQIASALDYAHGREVVHLDVKPANVIISGNDQATLTDFSIAQALNPGATRSATIAGTPLYMSPEQIQGKELDSRSDIYSLGLLLFEMCVGHPPFQGQFVTVMYAHLHSPVPDVQAAMPQVPEGLANVIYRALAKDRNERFQTAGEVLRALERALPRDDKDESGTMRLGREEVDSLLAEAAQDEAGEQALPATPPGPDTSGARPAQVEGSGAWRRWLVIGAFVIMVLAVIVVLIAVIHGSGSSGGSVAVVSEPAGAAVTLDGSAKGHAPITLSGITAGSHTVSLSLPAYHSRSVRVTVSNGLASQVNGALIPLSVPSVISAVESRITTSYSVDRATGKVVVGPAISHLTASEVAGKTIYAVSTIKLKNASADAPQAASLSYRMYYPDDTLLASLPSPQRVTLTAQRPMTTFASGFKLPRIGVSHLPPGRYTIRLLVDGTELKSIPFTFTK